MYNIKVCKLMGRGLYADKNINKGDIVTICELLILSEKDTKAIGLTELQYYTFKVNDLQDCLVLGDGELFNHDHNPNLSYSIKEIDGRLKMVFKAIRDISAGYQLVIDYKADSQVDITEYLKNKSLLD